MKTYRIILFSLAAASLMSATSCTSDKNPFDITVTPVGNESNVANIRLNLDVASTRAEDDMSTDSEKKITKVSIYVFDENNELELSKSDISVSLDSPAEIEVTPGLKTLYVVASKTMISESVSKGTPLTNFEETVFSSKISDLKTNDGFVMVGKSEPQQVFKSANQNELPSSNIFNIEMVRLLSKTQVKVGDIDVSNLGFRLIHSDFCVSQTNDNMRLVAKDGVDIQSSYTDSDGNGTYDGYTVRPYTEYQDAVSTAFTAEGCHYVTENIVNNPVAGNTTFVSFRVELSPNDFYFYDEIHKELTKSSNTIDGVHFYTVGVVDEKYGLEDFTLDPETHHILTFQSQNNAEAYVRSLNSGESSAITVSETETPLRAPATGASDVNSRQFQTMEFERGRAYYRINLTSADGTYKVERNRFYKIEVKSIRNLGVHSEDILRPKEPTSALGNLTSAWIETVLTVAPWEEVNQDAEL